MDHDSHEPTATERARWLAELAVAIEQAQVVAWRIGVIEGDEPEALELYARLEAAREEVDALRRGSWTGVSQDMDPAWLRLLPWRTRQSENSG